MVLLLLMLALAEPAEVTTTSPTTQPMTVPATQPALPARVVSVRGQVQARTTADASWKPVAVDDVLAENTEVRTGVRSSVVLRMADGVEMTIDRLGVIKLSKEEFHDGRFGPNVGMKYGRTKLDLTPATAPATQPVMPASTKAVEGNAQFRAAPRDEWKTLEPGVTLAAGAQVRVGPRSSVRLQLVDGREVELVSMQTYTLVDQNLESGRFFGDEEFRARSRGPLWVR